VEWSHGLTVSLASAIRVRMEHGCMDDRSPVSSPVTNVSDRVKVCLA
jgi:hypothetical protein